MQYPFLQEQTFKAFKGNYGKYPQQFVNYGIRKYFTGKGKPMSFKTWTPKKKSSSYTSSSPAKKARKFTSQTIGRLALANAIRSGELQHLGGKRYKRRSTKVTKRTNKGNSARLRGRSRLPAGKRTIRSTWKRNAPRRQIGSGVSLKQLGDMLLPRVKFKNKGNLESITWDSNEQGYQEIQLFPRSGIENYMTKLASSDIQRTGGGPLVAGGVGQLASAKCKFDTLIRTINVVNACNMTTQVKVTNWVCRRPTSFTLKQCWEHDADVDDSLTNTTAPTDNGQALTGTGSYGTNLLDRNLPHSYVRYYWKQETVNIATLDVGEMKNFTLRMAPFTFDPAKADMVNTNNLGGDVQFAFVPGISRITTIIGRTQMVLDNSVGGDANAAHGSGKLSLSFSETLFARGCWASPTYQTIYTGRLNDILLADQEVYNQPSDTTKTMDVIG